MAKKTFDNLNNTTAQIQATKNIFGGEVIAQETTEASASAGKQEVERKSKRFNLMFKPSFYEQLQELATEKGMSVGTLINSVLMDYVNKRETK